MSIKQTYLVTVEVSQKDFIPDEITIQSAIGVHLDYWSDVKAKKVNVKESLEITYA